MADSSIQMLDVLGQRLLTKMIDNGDGTYSLGVAITTSSPGDTAWIDRSGTITLGATAQTGAAARAARKRLMIINPSNASESLWFNFTTAATAASPSIELRPGDRYVEEGATVTNELISIIAATTGHVFTIKEA